MVNHSSGDIRNNRRDCLNGMEYVLIFVAVFVIDILYTYYLKAVQDNKAAVASLLAAAVYVLASVVVINYTENHLLLIAAAFGAMCGTYIGMRMKSNGNRNVREASQTQL